MTQKTLYPLLFLLLPATALGQGKEIYSTGLVDDLDAIKHMPMKKELLTRDYTSLPVRVSLKDYCPRAGSQSYHGQGDYATCTAWATTYAAMTIMEAIRWGWIDREIITDEAFSPLFVYAKTKFKEDDDCSIGIGLHTALPFLKDVGAPKFRNYNTPCADHVPRWVADEAADHRITDYMKLFDDPYPSAEPAKKVRVTKKSIAERKPVIFAMDVPNSFDKAGEVWQGEMEEGEKLGKHSMCIVGYDDEKAGGAFLVLNSWGESWGADGFTWVRYDDFVRYANYAFEIFLGTDNTPVTTAPQVNEQHAPIPAIAIADATEKTLAGSLSISLSTGESVEMGCTSKKSCPVYKAKDKFPTGSRFRLYLTNNAPAYVYVIGSDIENKVDSVFPPDALTSPALTYANGTIALPGEQWWAELDNNSSKNYFCVLYATHALPMDRIMDFIANGEGNIADKLTRALDTLCKGERVMPEDIKCEEKGIAFSATTTGNIVPLVVEVNRH